MRILTAGRNEGNIGNNGISMIKKTKVFPNTYIIYFIFVVAILGSIAAAQPDILIADFESSDYGDWEVTGEAFGPSPAQGTLPNQHNVSGFKGRGLVNSFYKGDATTGTLTSPAITVKRDFITFLIGGGGYQEKTCMNLLLDGEVVRTATGSRDVWGNWSEKLEFQSWNVKDLRDKKVVLQIIDNHTGGWGHIHVDHIYQSDRGKILTRERIMPAQKKYINFPVKTGSEMKRLMLWVDNEQLEHFDIELCSSQEADFHVFMRTNRFKGNNVKFTTSCTPYDDQTILNNIVESDKIIGSENLYNEKYRPQFHYSAKRGWKNDTNGLVYYDGTWHLFYQHNPFGFKWGNMHWGHAVSSDLVHWKEVDKTLHPDEFGTIFSGSGIVDHKNTSGLKTGSEKPIILVYTYAGSLAPEPRPFTQAIAYSNDGGKTFTKYNKNPVLGQIKGANRDPKVIWHESSKQWIMALYIDANVFQLLGSKNLKQWTKLSDVGDLGTGECPDFFPLAVDGNKDDMRWVFWTANSTYLLGNFDGKNFVPDGTTGQCYAAGTAYAGQTFDNAPGGRRIHMPCIGLTMTGMPFNQMIGFPVELTLKKTEEGVRMFAWPVNEIENIHTKQYTYKDVKVSGQSNLLGNLHGKLFDISVEFEPESSSRFGFNISNQKLIYDSQKQIISFGNHSAELKTRNGTIKLRFLVDRSSIEIFGNDGRIYMPIGHLFDANNDSLGLFSEAGDVEIKELEINVLRSIWF